MIFFAYEDRLAEFLAGEGDGTLKLHARRINVTGMAEVQLIRVDGQTQNQRPTAEEVAGLNRQTDSCC